MSYRVVFPDEIIVQNLDSYGSFILMLSEPDTCKQVPIVVGAGEAQAILIAKENITAGRPMTHTLMTNLMSEYGLSLKKVTIDRFIEGVFYATLVVTDGFGEKKIDSRPSDAVTLALLDKCPILISDDVLEEVGIEHNALVDNLPDKNPSIEELEDELRRCEDNEEYERAAEIMEQISKLKGEL